MDLRRYKLIRERKQYIGVSNREAYQAMCEDLAFAQLLQQRDEADGVCRLMPKTEYDQRDIEDLLE